VGPPGLRGAERLRGVAEGAGGGVAPRGRQLAVEHRVHQAGQRVGHHTLLHQVDGGLHHQQERPAQRAQPVGGAELRHVLTDLVPVLTGEERPAEQEEETCREEMLTLVLAGR